MVGTPGDWLAPRAPGPVRARVRLPGSKSMTNRALILAALSDRPTVINGPLVARDTMLMAGALRSLGCRIEEQPGAWRVEPAGLRHPAAGGRATHVDVGNAGTVLRFVPPVAALTSSEVRFTGDERVSRRPVGPLLAALREAGAEISDNGSGSVPFVVHGHGSVAGGPIVLDASSSSQLVSGLLLAAALFDKGAQITHSGPPVPSAPHIEMTVRMLRSAGVHATAEAAEAEAARADGSAMARPAPASADGSSPRRSVTRAWRVAPGRISAGRIDIEPDLSNALPFLAAALATGGQVTVAGWPADSLQPAPRILELLGSMGATTHLTAEGLRLAGSG